MGIAIPQLAPASLDRTSGAQVIDGSLKFDGGANSSASSHLLRTSSSYMMLVLGLQLFPIHHG